MKYRKSSGKAGSMKAVSGRSTPEVATAAPTVDWTVLLLALTMFMAPTMGVPSEEMLQDTLKSIIISFGTLIAAFTFVWQRKDAQSTAIGLHPLLLLPLGLAIYALGSMTWSHTYLAGAETIRWLMFSLLLWTGLNTLQYAQVPRIATGIHLGAVGASIWTALQFLIDFNYFPQGPNPASTFVNRNFFAEYIVCTLPYSVFLLTRERTFSRQIWIALSIGLNLSALMMTGTRSALVGLGLMLIIIPGILFRYWDQLEISKSPLWQRTTVLSILVTATAILSSIPTGNKQLVAEFGHQTATDRAMRRTLSMATTAEYTSGSFSVRAAMWKATGRMIQAHPLAGVGAGAWEVEIPLYQDSGTQLETDFYAHNEPLQLLAEYGIVGWGFLLCLIAYLLWSTKSTVRSCSAECVQEAPLRALVLTSILMLLTVSNAGFPWRLAATGALFALSLAILAASDIRVRLTGVSAGWKAEWRATSTRMCLWFIGFSIAIAAYITQQAFVAERSLVRAIKIALTITKSGRPNDAYWDSAKEEMHTLLGYGIAINPHYRKLTPMAADEMASWGDWEGAIWIWESVLASRPNVVAIIANISRGYLQIGNYQQAMYYLANAAKLQPNAPVVQSMQVILLTRLERYTEASAIIKTAFKKGNVDYDLVYTAYLVGMRTKDWPLAMQALDMRIKKWPNEAYDGWLRMGDIYARLEVGDTEKAMASYKKALDVAPEQLKPTVWSKIPPSYQSKIPK